MFSTDAFPSADAIKIRIDLSQDETKRSDTDLSSNTDVMTQAFQNINEAWSWITELQRGDSASYELVCASETAVADFAAIGIIMGDDAPERMQRIIIVDEVKQDEDGFTVPVRSHHEWRPMPRVVSPATFYSEDSNTDTSGRSPLHCYETLA